MSFLNHGSVGAVPIAVQRAQQRIRDERRTSVLLGEPAKALGASEYAGDGPFPRFDLAAEKRLSTVLRELARRRLVRSAQDVSDGGLAVALAECVMLGGVGATLQLSGAQELEVLLFSEDQGRAVVTCAPDDFEELLQRAAEHDIPAARIGSTGGDRLSIDNAIDLSIAELRAVWEVHP